MFVYLSTTYQIICFCKYIPQPIITNKSNANTALTTKALVLCPDMDALCLVVTFCLLSFSGYLSVLSHINCVLVICHMLCKIRKGQVSWENLDRFEKVCLCLVFLSVLRHRRKVGIVCTKFGFVSNLRFTFLQANL